MTNKTNKSASKVVQIQNYLRNQIINGTFAPGQRLPTEREFARQFDVSLPTVNKAMFDLQGEGVLERSPKRGTVVRNVPIMRRVALISRKTFLQDPRYYFFRKALEAVETYLAGKGVAIEVFYENPEADPESEMERLLEIIKAGGSRGSFDGVIFQIGPMNTEMVKRLMDIGMPIVGHNPQRMPYSVRHDHHNMLREATRILLEQGRRRIGVIQPSNAASEGNRQWVFLPDVKEILSKAGLPFHDEWVCTAGSSSRPDLGWRHFHKIWNGRGEKPDGLIVGVDAVFPETVMAILANNIRVPDDLMVVTHANKGSGQFSPFPVTMLECDPVLYGQTMVDMLQKQMNGEEVEENHVVLPFEIRTSGGELESEYSQVDDRDKVS